MSDTPEPLAAIIAEMRDLADHRAADAGGERPAIELLRSYADRIEAAAKNTENAFGMALAIEDGLHKRDKQSSPGNAAALRAALEWVADFSSDDYVDDEYSIDGQNLQKAAERARAALSAPARNCDRFATAEEAVAAFADHLRAWENAHGIFSECPDHPVKVPAGAFAWLFDKAEGGDHA